MQTPVLSFNGVSFNGVWDLMGYTFHGHVFLMYVMHPTLTNGAPLEAAYAHTRIYFYLLE